MKAKLLSLAGRVDALPRNQRAMIFLLPAAALIIFIAMVVILPQRVLQKKLGQQLAQDQSVIVDLQVQTRKYVALHAGDADAAGRARIAMLAQKNSRLRADLDQIESQLIAPSQMAGFLQQLLKNKEGLRVIALKSMPVQQFEEAVVGKPTLAANKTAAPVTVPIVGPPASPTIYRHAMEITLEGTYLEMLDYLKALEATPGKLFWERLTLTVQDYPKATLSLTIFTLSLDKKWIRL